YADAVKQASRQGIEAEPEAQLTVPLSNLLTEVAALAGIGHLTLMREARLTGVRPDFAASLDGHPCGWVELKSPGHTLDGDR
ncbi:hypothetical protein, partial [Neisseria gonorrhoeae]